MAGTIHAELTDDSSQILLFGVGEDYEQKIMGEALSHLTPAIKKEGPAAYVPATWPTVVQLVSTFNGNHGGPGWLVQGPRLAEWVNEQFARRLPRDEPYPLPLPEGCVPRDYQVDGARQIAYSGKFLLLDEPGLGKTVSSLLGLAWRQHLGTEIFPAIIITPGWDICDSWQREIAKWMPGWRTALWGGAKRAELAGTADCYLTTYATTLRDSLAGMKGPLIKLRAKTVVVDEVHWIKGDGKRTHAVQRIARHAGTFTGLSGTVITQDIRDLWPTLEAMEHLSWPSGKRLTSRYCVEGYAEYGNTIDGLNPLRKTEFYNTLLGSYRRVAKADVLTQLPPKIYSLRRVSLPDEWQKAYDGMEADMLAELPDGQELQSMDTLSKLTRLCQMASSAFTVDVTEETDKQTSLMKKHYRVTLKRPCWKASALLEIMDERRGLAPVVAFAPSRQLVTIAGQMAEEAGYRTGYVLGIGKGVTRENRTAAIDSFQAGKLDLLCVTTRAGGTGITLTAAGTAVFLQRPWAFDDATQAENRVHRIGSEKHTNGIEIIDIVARKTVDYRVRAKLREKGANLSELIQDPRLARELLGGL
jgi:SNF2 family DNA or RNA helicase